MTTELQAERTQIATRLLELEVQETEWSRQYYVENRPTSMKDRSTLVAERARLKLRLHQINLALHAARVASVEVVEGGVG